MKSTQGPEPAHYDSKIPAGKLGPSKKEDIKSEDLPSKLKKGANLPTKNDNEGESSSIPVSNLSNNSEILVRNLPFNYIQDPKQADLNDLIKQDESQETEAVPTIKERIDTAFKWIVKDFPHLKYNDRDSQGFISFSLFQSLHEYDYMMQFQTEKEGNGHFLIYLFHEGGSDKKFDVEPEKTEYNYEAKFVKAEEAGKEMESLHKKYLQKFQM